MPDSDGLLYKKNLKIGVDELQWLQNTTGRAERGFRVASMLTYGLVLGRYPDGSLEDQWSLSDDDDDGSVTIKIASSLGDRPIYAAMVDDNGYVAVADVDMNEVLTLPNDNTWHTITARAAATQHEPGSILVTIGSATVIGTDTHFNLLSGKTSSGFGRGSKLRIDAADSAAGNAGEYEIDTIVSDTELTLVTAVPGGTETIARWTIAGDFLSPAPADHDIHQRRAVLIERQTGIQREPAAGTIPLYDVKRNDAAGPPKVKFIDRRAQRMYRMAIPEGLRSASVTALHVQQDYDLSGGPPFTALLKYGIAALGAVSVVANAVCPTLGSNGEPNRTMLAYEDGGTITFARDDDPVHFTMVYIPTGATFAGAQPALVRLPPASGFSHLVCYIEGGILKAKRSSDSGTTWGAAITVLDPTANDPLDTCSWPSVIRLLNGRLLVAVQYDDNSGGDTYVVACFSDDHGATWDTNTGIGYEVVHITTPGPQDAGRPSLGQSADGHIWCAYTVDTTDIGLIRSTEPLGDFSDMGLTNNSAHIVVERGTYFDNVNTPALWISPDGHPVIVYHGFRLGTTSSYLVYACIGYQADVAYVLDQQQLWKNDNGVAVPLDLGIAICQDNGGPITMAWISTPTVANDTYVTKLLPASMPIQYGGNNRYRVV